MGSHRHNHKGQSAIEYLTTYGWALLAIGMVIAVLAAWGVFNPCQKVEPSFTGQEIALEQWQFTDQNTIQFEFRAVQEDVNVTSVTVSTDDSQARDTRFYSEVVAGQSAVHTVDVTGLFTSGECASADLRVVYDAGEISGINATASRALGGPVP